MKNEYKSPEISVVYFKTDDIITASSGDELPDDIPDELSYDDGRAPNASGR